MDDFEQISIESYANVAKVSFDTAQRQFEDNPVVQAITDDIIRDWTNPDYREAPQLELGTSVTEFLQHPCKHEFDETDAKRIATVWVIGMAAVESAKRALLANPEFNKSRATKYPLIAYQHLFSGGDWYQLHPESQETQPGYRSQTTDVLDTANMQSWPKGGFINCLGVSIAMAAAADLDGHKFVYGNELRQSQTVINEHHSHLMSRFESAWPGFSTDPVVREAFSLIDSYYPEEIDERYANIIFDIPDILKERSLPRDFHHSIRVEHADDYQKASNAQKEYINTEQQKEMAQYGAWVQLDPYSLIYRDMDDPKVPYAARVVLSRPGSISDVALHDASKNIDGIYRKYVALLDGMSRYRKVAISQFTNDARYKSHNWPDEIFETSLQHCIDIHKEVDDDEFDEVAEGGMRSVYAVLFFGTLSGIAKEYGITDKKTQAMQATMIRRYKEKPESYTQKVQQHFAKLEKQIVERAQYDTKLRNRFFETIKGLPLLCTAYLYRMDLQTYFNVRGNGFPDAATELANPYFMIGAMYMNHYATWRKDGRINVARHLARLSSSQLLWQAALQDGEEPDERVKALGETIRGLNRTQTHPLVNIARGIY